MNLYRVLQLVALVSLATLGANAQETSQTPDADTVKTTPVDARAYGVLPNYRTAELGDTYRPITAKQKFTIARKDTLDWPSYFTAAMFSGISQVNNSNPDFGQGMKGFAHRYGVAVLDQSVGNFLTEGALPSLFHQDPRYFRKGTGSAGSRILWAASRVAVVRTDSGHWTFNASEFLGNGMVASLGNLYYPESRGFSPTMQRMFSQIATDALSQVLKEYWPDVKKKLAQRKKNSAAPMK